MPGVSAVLILFIGLALGAAIGRDVASFLWTVVVAVVTHPKTCFQLLVAGLFGASTLATLDLASEKMAKYRNLSGGWFFITGMLAQIYVVFVILQACGGIAVLRRAFSAVSDFALSKYVIAIISGVCGVFLVIQLIATCTRLR